MTLGMSLIFRDGHPSVEVARLKMKREVLYRASGSERGLQPKKEIAKSSSDSYFVHVKEWNLLVIPELGYDVKECSLFKDPLPM